MSLIARRRFALARWQCAFWMKAMMRICALHLGHPSTSPVVLELLLCLLPRVAPEHAVRFGGSGIRGASELGRLRIGIQIKLQKVCSCSRMWIVEHVVQHGLEAPPSLYGGPRPSRSKQQRPVGSFLSRSGPLFEEISVECLNRDASDYGATPRAACSLLSVRETEHPRSRTKTYPSEESV
jgi:hypothetical protein